LEHRQHPRFAVQFNSSFSSLNIVSGKGTLADLSIRGCRIISDADVKSGTTLRLRVEISRKQPPIEIAQAVARWCRDGSFGLEFVSLAPDEWARLQQVVKELELEPYQRAASSDDAA